MKTILLICFFIAILIAAYLLGFLPQHVEICKQGEEGGPQNCAIYPLIQAIIAYVEAHEGFITAIATIIIAAFTGTLWVATNGMLKSAAEQGKAMERSIAESARAAGAMEKLATNSDISINAGRKLATQQMRAYLTVVFGTATYQDRSKKIRFGAMPRIVNTGHTPAHKVGHRSKAAILKAGLPDDFDFPLAPTVFGASVIGPSQFNDLSVYVDADVPEDEVANIKIASGQALYVWGIVTYNDAFDVPRETRYCQYFMFLGEGENQFVRGYYEARHNEAT